VGAQATSESRSTRLADVERVLAEQGHDLGIGRARIAFSRTGIAIGFPRDPMIHVSWWVIGATAALVALRRAYRSRRN
jgi:hypothetical protein